MMSKGFIYVLLCVLIVFGFGGYTLWRSTPQQPKKVYKTTPIAEQGKGVFTKANVGERQDTDVPADGTAYLKSLLTPEQLESEKWQHHIKVTESDEYREFKETDPTLEEDFNFLADRGIDVPRNVNTLLFRQSFPTGEPADFEPEMRARLKEMFIAASVQAVGPAPLHLIQRAKALTDAEKEHVNQLVDRYGIEGTVERLGVSDPELAELFEYGAYGALEQDRIFNVITAFWEEDDKRAFHWSMGQFKGRYVGEGSSFEWAEAVLAEVTEAAAADPFFYPSQTPVPVVEEDKVKPVLDAAGTANEPKEAQNRDIPTVISTEPEIRDDKGGEDVKDRVEPITESGTEFATQFTESDFGAALQAQFSPERRDAALGLLNRYGREEGLRRLKTSDPELAKQMERGIRKSAEVPE